jgi:hypothetical protein
MMARIDTKVVPPDSHSFTDPVIADTQCSTKRCV